MGNRLNFIATIPLYQRILPRFLFIFLLIFTSNISFAIEKVPSATTELYVKSGLKRQVDSFSSIILAQVQAAIQKDPDKNKYQSNEIKRLVKQIGDVFEAPELKIQALEVLAQELSPSETKKILDWLSSPVGKKVAWYEDHLDTPAGYLNIHEYEKAITKKPPPEDYRNTISKLTSNMKVIETAVDMALVNEVLVNSAMASLQPNFTTKMLDDITKQTKRNKSKLEQQVSEYMKLPMLFTYSYLSKNQLSTYLEFTGTALGNKYFSVMVKALNATFTKASVEFREKISN